MRDILSIIYEKGDVPALYYGEAVKYIELVFASKSTIGAYTFTSDSSSITYSGGSGGQQQLFDDLSVALEDYQIIATDWNAVRSLIYGEIVPVISSVKQDFTYDSDKDITIYKIFQPDGTTLILQDDFTYDSDKDISTFRRRVYDTNGTTVLMDYTDTYTYDSDKDIDQITRAVTV